MTANLLLYSRIFSACGIPFCIHGVCDHGHPGSGSCRTELFHARHRQGTASPLKMRRASRLGFAPIRAAKLPRGVEPPRDEPKLPVPFWGFTENAEVWNSRASLIGIFGIIIVEAIINKDLLQTIGIEVGKGLDLPL